MTWRHRTAIFALVLLAGLPAAGAMCAMACEPASAAATPHHGAGQNCEMPASPFAGPQMRGVSAHDCGSHDADARLIRTTAAKRADVAAKAQLLTAGTGHGTLVTLPDLASPRSAHAGPPGAPPSSTTPVVLRV